MEKDLERYYTEFERPPFAPTFTPTEEEFSDPISYVAKIKSEAEKYGLIKIIPPKSFRPPFCIDSTKFEFTPRVQRLNEIDALFRLRIIFINKLVKFWQIQGQQFRIPYIDNKYIDLYRLRELVAEEGGHKKVSQARKWSQIAKILGFKPNAGPSMKYHYNKWIYAFDMNTTNENTSMEEEPSTSAMATSTIENEQKEAKEEKSSPKTRSQSRMMAGAGKKAKPVPSLDKSSIKAHRTPIESVVCAKCGSGDDEARLLLCETCDSSLHTYCTNPPMSTVPKGEWRCQKCVANALKSVSTDFGFVDSNQHFNLETFGEWANTYKQQYFNQEPLNVPSEKVEQEFWRNVIDIDKAVQVKYGADLISSKVGSGFPRRDDAHRSIDAKERQLYANHPWNLNNLPKLRESVLCHMNMDISGMMVPWVYVGMLFSTFCWHVEDHWTYSINYNHLGERKIWYGVPGDEAENFDNVMKESAPELFTEQKDLLHHMTTALNPRYLIDRGIPVYTVHQNAGEFVITFPRAYHAGYNEGLNFAEAVNFAPPDWLRMGRQCLENYANVRRNCVFSHEELVMKMVSASHKMSIGMCTSTLEELSWIVAKETEFRKKLTAAGLRESQFCKFEELPDDDRACTICRTTLFSSGLVCQHEGRIVCIHHVDQLCEKCQVNNCCLKFRYTLEDLVPMIKRLSERTNAFYEWKNNAIELTTIVKEVENPQIANALKNGQPRKKIDMHKMRILADQWKNSRFPHCDEIHQMNRVLADFERLAVNINKILNRKIRLRDQTRCQKADTRCDHAEFLLLFQQLKQSIFEDKELEMALEEISNKTEEWKHRVQKALANGFQGVQSVDILYQLIFQAEEEFNVRMESEGLDNLKMELARRQWLLKAQNALELINHPTDLFEILTPASNSKEQQTNDDSAIEGEEQRQLNLQKLQKLITNSSRWSSICQLVHSTTKKLEEMFAKGKNAEDIASKFLENADGQGVEKAEKCWQTKLAAVNWIQSEAMDKFRAELQNGRQIQKEYSTLTEEAFTLKMLEQLNQHCTNSLFERNGHRHRRVKELLTSVNTFVERIRTIFQKAVSYYNLFDIIAGRSDLPALVEGDPIPLSHFTSTKYSDNWQQLRIFDTKTQLLAHLNAITEQQSTLLHALRLANEERPMKETCNCAKDHPTIPMSKGSGGHHHPHLPSKRASGSNTAASNEELNGIICCFICNAKFHGNCALWDPFLSRLPVGLYLCPRCVRSRRPCIEDVESACSSSELPENNLERMLVQNLVHRSTNTFTQLHRLLHAIPKGIDTGTINDATKLSLSEWLTMALSLEVIDTEVYRMLTTSAYFDIFPIPECQKIIWQQIQKKTFNAEPLPIIFSMANISIHSQSSNRRISGTKRRSGGNSTTKNKRKSREKTRRTEDELADEGNDDSLLKVEEDEDEEGEGGVRKKRASGDIEKCAADFCLKPYSEFTRWIQCEAGCERWYHFCCVGISVRGAQLISSYCCYKCSSTQT